MGVSAFVLAGGKSTRMGTDKAFVEFAGSTLLARAMALAASANSQVWIVGARSKFVPFGPVVEDEFPDHGPLGGIHAALRTSRTDLNFLLAVDMPFVETRFVEYLIAQAQSVQSIVTAPRSGGRWQPLCAIYRREFADAAEQSLLKNENKIDTLFAQLDVRTVEEQELSNAGFTAEMFRNVNTPEDIPGAE